MKSVLITGGTGAFGQAFTERLLRDGLASRVCIYSRNEHSQFLMRQRFKEDERLRYFIGDVRDRWRLLRAFDGVDYVVHAAALKRIEVGFYNPIEMVKTNVDGAINVIEAAKDANVRRVVALSTDKAFQPVSAYGQSKALAESIFMAARNSYSGPRFSVTRYGNVWGSTGSIGDIWPKMLEDGGYDFPLPVTDLRCTRFFMTMDQAVQLVLDTIRDMPEEIAIPTLPAYRLGDLVEAMGAKTITVIGLPKWEKLHEFMCEGNGSDTARRMSIEELKAAIKNV